jgi:hypothetical protein
MNPNTLQAALRDAIPVSDITGDDDVDTQLLREMAEKAAVYVRSLSWCLNLHEQLFGEGVGGIAAIFLFRVAIRKVKKPERIWVVVGDFPSAYMEFEAASNPQAVLLRYVEGVEEWLDASVEERDSGDLIPIYVPPGDEFIQMLRGRMGTLRSLVLPHLRGS